MFQVKCSQVKKYIAWYVFISAQLYLWEAQCSEPQVILSYKTSCLQIQIPQLPIKDVYLIKQTILLFLSSGKRGLSQHFLTTPVFNVRSCQRVWQGSCSSAVYWLIESGDEDGEDSAPGREHDTFLLSSTVSKADFISRSSTIDMPPKWVSERV